MGVLETVLDKVMFWRRDDDEFDVDGCFTLPGAELDGPADAADDCDVPEPDQP